MPNLLADKESFPSLSSTGQNRMPWRMKCGFCRRSIVREQMISEFDSIISN
jgi:hypothetical protein